MKQGKLHGQAMLKICFLNLVLAMCGLHKMLETVNIYYVYFHRGLKIVFFQDWLAKINESPKAEHYRYFKSLLDIEKYSFLDLSFKYRNALAKFRCSSHDLMIEKGRHMHLDRLYRICPLCVRRNAYVLEDEYHFLMVCPQNEDIRYKFFPDNMIDNVSLNKFYSFLTSKNE